MSVHYFCVGFRPAYYKRAYDMKEARRVFSMHASYSMNPEKFPHGDTEALSRMLFQYAIVCEMSLNMLFVRSLTLFLSVHVSLYLPLFSSVVWWSLSGSSVIVSCPLSIMGSSICIKGSHRCGPWKLWQYQTVSRPRRAEKKSDPAWPCAHCL